MTGAGGSGTSDPLPVSTLVCASCGRKNRIRPSERGAPHCGSCGSPLPWLVDATDATFDVEARAAPAVLVDLWAPWCGPCRTLAPVLEELARETAGRARVVKLNVDENPAAATRFRVGVIPTLLVLAGGREVDRLVGVHPKATIAQRLERAIA